MSSKIQICNDALTLLSANTINSFNDGSVESVHCNAVWDIALQQTLREYKWHFAVKRSNALARTNITPFSEYTYEYTVPSDFLRLIDVYPNNEYSLEGRQILTNNEDCYIKYIHLNNDTSTWDASFVKLMVLKIAGELAFPLTKTGSIMDRYHNLYERALAVARLINDSEKPTFKITYGESSIISTRKL